jgi:hypothetical protein
MNFKEEYLEALRQAGSVGNLSIQNLSYYTETYANATISDNINNLITGKIFTFFYQSELKEEDSFINRRPLLFLVTDPVERKNGVIKGIDLMLLPPRDRLNFFIRLFKIYEGAINQNIKKEEAGELGAQMPLKMDQPIIETLFMGINYNHAYKGYKIPKIKRLKQIPIRDWKNLVYLNTKSIEGINIEEIYNRYK